MPLPPDAVLLKDAVPLLESCGPGAFRCVYRAPAPATAPRPAASVVESVPAPPAPGEIPLEAFSTLEMKVMGAIRSKSPVTDKLRQIEDLLRAAEEGVLTAESFARFVKGESEISQAEHATFLGQVLDRPIPSSSRPAPSEPPRSDVLSSEFAACLLESRHRGECVEFGVPRRDL